jgi:antitoxin ParD1/3/4
MQISLPPELAQFVAQLVQSGRYDTESEVVCQGLWLLRDHEELRKIRIEELRKVIAVGIEQADRGEVAPLDMQAILAKSREQLAQTVEDGDASSPANQPSRT